MKLSRILIALSMFIVLIVAPTVALFSCATTAPTPDQFIGYVADCGAAECKAHCPEMVGMVTTCLLNPDVATCMNGLLVPASGITRDVIACVARQLGSQANARVLSGQMQPNDQPVANAARKWILDEKLGYR